MINSAIPINVILRAARSCKGLNPSFALRATADKSLLRPTGYRSLDHAARHEASDVDLHRTARRAYIDRPYHRPASPVRFLDHGVVGNVPPLVFDADAIMAVFRFPIDICQRCPISVGATRALA